jgi:uncharacterized protein YcaQ
LEIYVPKEKRKFGYYCLNILYNNRIVGRLDPKMHRDKAMLEVKAFEVVDGFKISEDFLEQLAKTLLDFMKFHAAETCKIADSCPEFLRTLNLSLQQNARQRRNVERQL